MEIDLVCFSKFVNEETCDYTNAKRYRLPEGGTVADLATQLGIDHRDIKIAFVNRRTVGLDTVLNDGDRVGLAPAVGGM